MGFSLRLSYRYPSGAFWNFPAKLSWHKIDKYLWFWFRGHSLINTVFSFRSRRLGVFYKKNVLNYYTKFTWKYLQWSPFYIKFANLGLQLYYWKDFISGVFLITLRNSSKQLFYRASVNDYFLPTGWLLPVVCWRSAIK